MRLHEDWLEYKRLVSRILPDKWNKYLWSNNFERWVVILFFWALFYIGLAIYYRDEIVSLIAP